MGNNYRPRRTRLKRHDAGSDRHSKTVAYESKAARLAAEHNKVQPKSSRRKRRGT